MCNYPLQRRLLTSTAGGVAHPLLGPGKSHTAKDLEKGQVYFLFGTMTLIVVFILHSNLTFRSSLVDGAPLVMTLPLPGFLRDRAQLALPDSSSPG